MAPSTVCVHCARHVGMSHAHQSVADVEWARMLRAPRLLSAGARIVLGPFASTTKNQPKNIFLHLILCVFEFAGTMKKERDGDSQAQGEKTKNIISLFISVDEPARECGEASLERLFGPAKCWAPECVHTAIDFRG